MLPPWNDRSLSPLATFVFCSLTSMKQLLRYLEGLFGGTLPALRRETPVVHDAPKPIEHEQRTRLGAILVHAETVPYLFGSHAFEHELGVRACHAIEHLDHVPKLSLIHI